jgi:exopolysaccharide biosynthesis predicted pyruvyltransferase EpsI
MNKMDKMNKMNKTIKKTKIYRKYEYKLKFFILLLLIMQIISSMKINKGNKIIRFIICNSPSHYNYGDDAILISTQEFLKAHFPHIKQIKIYFREVLFYTRLIKYIINENDIIIINGGGYFGEYEHVIKEHVKIVDTFYNNHIIFFPCSIYSINENKKVIYEEFLKIFNKHNKLTLFTRDSNSYQNALNLFRTKDIYNVPDIVTRLNLNFLKKQNQREGILLILRKDELILNHQNRVNIKQLVHKYFNNENIFEKDSNAYKLSPNNTRENQTYKFINNLAKNKLVITDRLHGRFFHLLQQHLVLVLTIVIIRLKIHIILGLKNFHILFILDQMKFKLN